jgi:serine/threonine protein kinase
VSWIEEDVANVMKQSPFLQKTFPATRQTTTAVFSRSELLTNPAPTGRGGFSVVHEVIGIQLDPEVSARCTPEQQQARLRLLQQGVLDESSGQSRFVIKHLQEKLLTNAANNNDKAAHKKFCYAASDLVLEGAYLQALDHSNILSVKGLPFSGLHSYRDGHDGYFLLLDRLEDTLNQRIKSWRRQQQDVPVHTKTQIALQLAEALRYLHDNRILFRDLKPHNVGFTADGRVQLFDFGLCRELPAVGDMNELYSMSGVGTRRYMAVEVINDGYYNCKADVYSFAMVLWEMLSLQKPFALYSAEDHRIQVCQGGERPAFSLSSWPVKLQELLRHCWIESVERRWSSEQVVQQLHRILREQQHVIPDTIKSRRILPRLRIRHRDLRTLSPVAVNDARVMEGPKHSSKRSIEALQIPNFEEDQEPQNNVSLVATQLPAIDARDDDYDLFSIPLIRPSSSFTVAEPGEIEAAAGEEGVEVMFQELPPPMPAREPFRQAVSTI